MMEIEQHIWGMTPEGEAVVLYTMRNASGAEVRLGTYGAAVVSVAVPDRNGRMDDVALGYKNYDDYFCDPAAIGKSVGRCAGRIAGGRMRIEGTEYRLETNNGPGHLGGGTRGFADRLWEGRVETNRVVMSLLSEEGDQGYPGTLAVEAVFDFGDDNALEITYLARTDRTTVVNLTSRLCLNLAGAGRGDILGHELRLAASRALELDTWQLPTGRTTEVAGTPLDFRSFRTIGEGIGAASYPTAGGSLRAGTGSVNVPEPGTGYGTELRAATGTRTGEEVGPGTASGTGPGIGPDPYGIRALGGYDHPFPIDGWRPNILAEAAELRDPQSGRRAEVLTSQPCIVLRTGNRLAGGCPGAEPGGCYADHAGVMLECQHYPDAVHHPAFPSPLLRADELYCQKTVYRFGTF